MSGGKTSIEIEWSDGEYTHKTTVVLDYAEDVKTRVCVSNDA